MKRWLIAGDMLDEASIPDPSSGDLIADFEDNDRDEVWLSLCVGLSFQVWGGKSPSARTRSTFAFLQLAYPVFRTTI